MNIIFIYAHMDDEVILSYGFIRKLLEDINNNVYLITCCNQSRDTTLSDRKLRYNVYYKNLNKYKNINIISYSNKDLTLTKNIVDLILDENLKKFHPDIVVTHSAADNHFEHRLISQEVLMFSRLNTNNLYIKLLLFAAPPMYFLTYNLFGLFLPNYFVDITKYIEDKRNALMEYGKIKEIPIDNNDIRSVNSCINYNKLCGYQINIGYAESYLQIFSIV